MTEKEYHYEVSIPYWHSFTVRSNKQLTRKQVLEQAHNLSGSIDGYDDSKAEIEGALKKDFTNASEQIAELQDDIRDLYAQIEQNINQIDHLYKGRSIEDEAPIPYSVDKQGMLHAPGPFKRNIREHVLDLLKDVEKNKEIISNGLMYYFLDNGFPEKTVDEICQNTS